MIHDTHYKLDLHTHSIASPDGGITEKEYTEIIAKKILDIIAVTDHNRIDFAQKMHKKLGDAIIVGEEIMTAEGEVIGLFLSVKVGPYQSLARTIELIHAQNGLVSIPHPFDPIRRGIGEENLLRHKDTIDILEGFNGRIIFPWQNAKAKEFAQTYGIPATAASDAHSVYGIGKAYTVVGESFTKLSAKKALSHTEVVKNYQPWVEYLRPKWNRIKKLV